MAKKYYAVKGEENRIFEDWNSCQNYIRERNVMQYKGFSTLEEANAFLLGQDYYSDRVTEDVKAGYAVAFTDGSYESAIAAYSFGVVAIAPDGKEEMLSGRGNDPVFLQSRNVSGEILGVLAAAEWAYRRGFPKLIVYHDYEGLAAWAENRWKAENPVSRYYTDGMKKFDGFVEILFRKVKGHSNHFFNDKVDALAKDALFHNERYFPDHIGAFRLDAEWYAALCNEIHRQAVRASYDDLYDGAGFMLGEDSVGVFPRRSGLLIAGKKYRLFCIAIVAALSFLSDKDAKRAVLQEAFSLDFSSVDPDRGEEISRFLCERCDEKISGAGILFALTALSGYIRKALKENGVSFDRISSVFREDNGKFRCNFDSVPNVGKLERAYEIFYSVRVPYFSKNVRGKEAVEILSEIEDILKER